MLSSVLCVELFRFVSIYLLMVAEMCYINMYEQCFFLLHLYLFFGGLLCLYFIKQPKDWTGNDMQQVTTG